MRVDRSPISIGQVDIYHVRNQCSVVPNLIGGEPADNPDKIISKDYYKYLLELSKENNLILLTGVMQGTKKKGHDRYACTIISPRLKDTLPKEFTSPEIDTGDDANPTYQVLAKVLCVYLPLYLGSLVDEKKVDLSTCKVVLINH